jgi:hypothetical protein
MAYHLAHLPFGIPSVFNGIKQILAMVIVALPGDLLGLVPHHGCLALQRLPVELDELRGTLIGHKTVCVDTKPIDMSEGTGNAVTGHGPEQGVKTARLLAEVIPSLVMSSGGLGNSGLLIGLDGVDEVGELDGILNEENRNVISDNVCWVRTKAYKSSPRSGLPKFPSSV